MSSNVVVTEFVEPISDEIVVKTVVEPEPEPVIAEEDKVEAAEEVSAAQWVSSYETWYKWLVRIDFLVVLNIPSQTT